MNKTDYRNSASKEGADFFVDQKLSDQIENKYKNMGNIWLNIKK